MSIEKLNRAARAAGCAMAPPEELFEEPRADRTTGGWTAARHEAQSDRQPVVRTSWLRDMVSGWTSKAPA
jgi:hypothetical protein